MIKVQSLKNKNIKCHHSLYRLSVDFLLSKNKPIIIPFIRSVHVYNINDYKDNILLLKYISSVYYLKNNNS